MLTSRYKIDVRQKRDFQANYYAGKSRHNNLELSVSLRLEQCETRAVPSQIDLVESPM